MPFGGWSSAVRSPSPTLADDDNLADVGEINHAQEINNTEYGDDGKYRPNPFVLAKRRADARAALGEGAPGSQTDEAGKKQKRGNVMPAAETEELVGSGSAGGALKGGTGGWQGMGGKRKADTSDTGRGAPSWKKTAWQKPTGWTNSRGEPFKHAFKSGVSAGSSKPTQQKTLLEALDDESPPKADAATKGKKGQGAGKGKKTATKAKAKKKQEGKNDDGITFGLLPPGAGPGSSFPIVQALEKQKSLPTKQKPKKTAVIKNTAEILDADSSDDSLSLLDELKKFDCEVQPSTHIGGNPRKNGGPSVAHGSRSSNTDPAKGGERNSSDTASHARTASQAPSLQQSGPTAHSDEIRTPSIRTTGSVRQQDQPSTMTHLSIIPFEAASHARMDDPDEASSSVCPPYSSPLRDKSMNRPLNGAKHADGIVRPVPRRPTCSLQEDIMRLENGASTFGKSGLTRLALGARPLANDRFNKTRPAPGPNKFDLSSSGFTLPPDVWTTFIGAGAHAGPHSKPNSSSGSNWRTDPPATAPARKKLPRLLAPVQIFKPDVLVLPPVPNEVPFWELDVDGRPHGTAEGEPVLPEPRMETGKGYKVTLWQPTPKTKVAPLDKGPGGPGRVTGWNGPSRAGQGGSKCAQIGGSSAVPVFRSRATSGPAQPSAGYSVYTDDWMADFRKPEAASEQRRDQPSSRASDAWDVVEDGAIAKFKWKKPAGFGLAK